MFCPKCGKMNPDEKELCSGCGAVLHEPNAQKPKKKKGVGAKIIAVIAAAAVVIGATAAATTSCNRQDTSVIAEACRIILIR